MMSLPARGAWIEIIPGAGGHAYKASLPARGAWIEIDKPLVCKSALMVAPRTGSVD